MSTVVAAQQRSDVLPPLPLTGEMEKHVRLLAEVAADWLTVHQIRKDFYLKLNKKLELSSVVDRLSSRLDQEETS